MKRVDKTQVLSYMDEVTVELQGVDERGELAVVSYHFDNADDTRGLSAKSPLTDAHRPAVVDALKQAGYQPPTEFP